MKLDLEFLGFKNIEDCIMVNGEFVKLTKNRKEKTYYYSAETTGKSEIVIYKTHSYVGKNWFWWNLLYFVISFFGLFDVKQDKKCLVIDGKFVVTSEKDEKIIIKRQNFEDGGKLYNIETEANIEEISNIQYYDKDARVKHKKMKKFKIFATIATLVVTALLIIFL